MWIIYKVIFPNGKVYIGQTKQTLARRRSDHFHNAKYERKNHKNCKFHNALLKYENTDSNEITWTVIDTVSSLKEALEKEAYHIEECNSIINGYNCRTSKNGKGYVDEETKQKIAIKNSELSKKMWQNPEFKHKMSEYMKKQHADGKFDEAKKKIAEIRSTPEQRQATSEDSKQRYSDLKKRDEMAIALGGKPFLVYKGDQFVGRFISIREAYRQLGIPNNGHISTILKRGKGTLYGYSFTYEKS